MLISRGETSSSRQPEKRILDDAMAKYHKEVKDVLDQERKNMMNFGKS